MEFFTWNFQTNLPRESKMAPDITEKQKLSLLNGIFSIKFLFLNKIILATHIRFCDVQNCSPVFWVYFMLIWLTMDHWEVKHRVEIVKQYFSAVRPAANGVHSIQPTLGMLALVPASSGVYMTVWNMFALGKPKILAKFTRVRCIPRFILKMPLNKLISASP